jgi:hypothetical protein
LLNKVHAVFVSLKYWSNKGISLTKYTTDTKKLHWSFLKPPLGTIRIKCVYNNIYCTYDSYMYIYCTYSRFFVTKINEISGNLV